MSNSSPAIRRLTCTTLDGKRYERAELTEAEIVRVVALPHSEWVELAPSLKHESLVYLIRQVHGRENQLFGELVAELSKRVARLASGLARGFDSTTTQHILWQVEQKILGLVLAKNHTRQTEFLEIAFGQIVEHFTINAVEKHKNSTWGKRGGVLTGDIGEDGEEVEGGIDVADSRPGPEEQLLMDEDPVTKRRQYQTARRAVTDPLNLQAAMLHFVEGWPIKSADPNVPDLMGYFGETEGKIKYRLQTAKNEMRQALGVKK